MPSGPAVSAVGPWISDSNRPACVECYAEFALFTRRHHCRRCGEVFCNKCSKYTSKEIPELPHYLGRPLRVCKCCFLRHLSFMVVARGAFGVKVELFGSRQDALDYYAKCRRSKLALCMNDNRILQSTFEDSRVELRLKSKAAGARNFLLGGHQFAGALVHDSGDHSRVTYAGEGNRVTPGASTLVFAALWGNAQWHYTAREIKSVPERQHAVDDFMDFCKSQKEISKAVVMTLRGLTAISAYADGVLTRTASAVVGAQLFLRQTPCVLVQHIGGHCTTRTLGTLSEGLEALDRVPSESSALLVSPRMEILARHRCDIQSFKQELCLRAGAALLSSMHNVTKVAVVSKREVVAVTNNLFSGQQTAEQEYLAHTVVGSEDDNPIAIFGLNNEARYAHAEGNPDPTLVEQATADLYELWVHGMPRHACRPVKARYPAHRLTQAALELIAAARSRAESERDGDGAAGATPRAPPRRSSQHSGSCPAWLCASGRDVSPGLQADLLMCSICMEQYDDAARRPTVCPACGNTVCLQCWSHIRECPMSRCPKPARPVVNVALLSLISAPTPAAASL